MTTIHFFDRCGSKLPGDHDSRYMTETTCEPCIATMLNREILREVEAATMRHFIALDRQECENEQAAEWAVVEDGERVMVEMGLLR